MTLKDIKDWLKTVITDEANFYIGKIDGNKEKCIGVYSIDKGVKPIIALGGLSNTSYDIKPISILIHWNKNAHTTELVAKAVYNQMFGINNITIAGKRIVSFDMQVNEPKSVGNDENGIYEYVIETNIIYER